MRGALVILAIWAAGGEAMAQSTSRMATVAFPNTEVRSGPSLEPKIYPTNILQYGQPVEVLDLKEDWIAIKPPHGSFSWINRAKVDPLGNQSVNFVVSGPAGTKAPTLIGSAVNGSQRPTVEGVSLPRGTQVRATGSPLKDGDGEWLPIEPPEGEKRWVKRASLAGLPAAPVSQPAVTNPNLVSGGTKSAVPGVLASGSSSPMTSNPANPNLAAPPPAPVSGLPPIARWNQAIQAESSGQPLEALRIYTEMTQEYASTNPDWASAAANRAQVLRNQGQAQIVPLVPSGQLAPKTPGATASIGPSNCAPYPAAQPGIPLVPVPYGTSPPIAQGMAPPSVPGTLTGRAGQPGIPRLQGYLRRSGQSINRKPMYTLETVEGRPITYILPTTSVSIDPYIDHRVEVMGGTYYYPDMRAEVLYVQNIKLLPQ